MLRKSFQPVTPDAATYLDPGTAYTVNVETMYSKGIPMDWIHLIFTGVASLILWWRRGGAIVLFERRQER